MTAHAPAHTATHSPSHRLAPPRLRHTLVAALLLAGAAWALPAQAQGPWQGRWAGGGGLKTVGWMGEQSPRSISRLPEGVQRLFDVPYGNDPLQRMDVYLPPASARPAAGPRAPILFMVHGGAWRTGDKAMERVVQEKVARWVPLGFVLVSVNYRLLPDTGVALQAHDVATALATVQQRAAQWGADGTRTVLMGHSAGAHLVALLNAQPALAQRAGAAPWLGAVSLDSAVLDLPALMGAPHAPLYDEAFGDDPAYWAALSPYDQLVPGAAPFQFVCSTVRPDHPCQQAVHMARRVREAGGRAEVLPQALSHGDINGTLGLDSDYTRAVETFMASLDGEVARRLGR
ncbi:alpha/beta hydrolase [Acidovorax sp. SUPP2522]|uniref:alpha/beta hydrolase n=1 Tax=unclassified Acidovorax TaxID=2684926 RepID=UPI00234A059B|nr:MULTISPECIES: alpha/beta hydrolase [unclassified Acidovorax]WCM97989.1 alpha/beta hydrolase [Acidovorax sp. GBBC 1281]GKT17504.1 alpha/beta hydrolase [Acidovorax sp. SUPP2522]